MSSPVSNEAISEPSWCNICNKPLSLPATISKSPSLSISTRVGGELNLFVEIKGNPVLMAPKLSNA